MSKEPNEILVMTTCKCRENNSNLVMTRTWFEEQLRNKISQGALQEQKRIIDLLEESVCCQDDCAFHEEINNVIAEIKGEK